MTGTMGIAVLHTRDLIDDTPWWWRIRDRPNRLKLGLFCMSLYKLTSTHSIAPVPGKSRDTLNPANQSVL
jgi:hypothetical protein